MARPKRARASSISLSLIIISWDILPVFFLAILASWRLICNIGQRRGSVRERAGDSSRFIERQVADLRASASISLAGRIDAQRRHAEPAIKGRLRNFDRL